MTTNNIIDRDKICIGKVTKINTVKELQGGICIVKYTPYRNILFTPDNNKANDLLYNSPKYDILELTSKTPQFNTSKIVVKDIYNISKTLIRLGYSEYLKQDDIIQIRKTVFNKSFLFDNFELFGLEEEIKPVNIENFVCTNDIDYYPTLLIRQIKYIITKLLNKQRYEISNSDDIEEMYEMMQQWNAILVLSDDRLRDFINKGFKIKLNAFKPNKKEGKIKILK